MHNVLWLLKMQNDEAREDSQEDDGIDLNEGRYKDISCGAFISSIFFKYLVTKACR